ncbi:MAG: Crp/Fnr family transcriptional regulator [Gemmatimonadetes bacterium]|jgi:CRP-like cAMP-binding protein|nr:Crp/Fnr family transcriptional regulator [Gemmatimonadota bacterium]
MMTQLEKGIFLQGTDFFHDAPSETLNAIGVIAREIGVVAGEAIFAENDPADAFYALIAGRVRYLRGGEEIRIREAGELFGLWSVFDGELRLVTAVAVEEARLLKVAYDDFQDLILESMDLGQGIYRVLAAEIDELVA